MRIGTPAQIRGAKYKIAAISSKASQDRRLVFAIAAYDSGDTSFKSIIQFAFLITRRSQASGLLGRYSAERLARGDIPGEIRSALAIA
ncbi:MAG: hypothetical protein OXI87_16460 [Albidovulum sp.]|nr:hypothetical protein [Albidovulum sp.]